MGKGQVKSSSSKVIAGDYFQKLLRLELPTMSEPNIELVTKFSIRGSKRQTTEKSFNAAVDIDSDLIQFKHF